MEGKGEDRLSSLPDAILLMILSLLPIRIAVATSVLSHRWRHLWTKLTSIEFCSKSEGPESVSILVRIIQQLTSPNLRNFCLKLHRSFNLFDADILESCFREVCRRNVETIYFQNYYMTFPNTGTFIPTCVFNSQYLVSLHLCGDLKFASAEIGVIQLPSLKVLRLSHLCDIGPWMDSLWSSPLLECLELRLVLPHNKNYVFNISALNLKFLELHNFDSESWTQKTKIFIHAPQLVNLETWGYCSNICYFVKNPTKLVDAKVDMTMEFDVPPESRNWMGKEERLHQLTEFVRGLSTVANLQLYIDAGANIFTCHTSVNHGILPAFLNLSRLQINLYHGNGPHCWKDLLLSLQCFPNLKDLELRMDGYPPLKQTDWCTPDFVPDCLATKLKTITINICEKNDADFKCFEYILSNGSVLEKLCIQWTYTDHFMNVKKRNKRVHEEHKFCKSLFKLPMSSSTCEVVFSGWCVKDASSKTFNGISFSCRISLDD